MPEQIRKIIDRIIEWWKKFTTKQKVLLTSIVAVIIVALGILAAVVSRPTMSLLITASSATEASKIQELLGGEGIGYDTSTDGFTFYVDKDDVAQANILLGSNEIPIKGYSIEDAVTGSFSLTASDKQKMYQSYLEDKLSTDLTELDIVEGATVQLTMADDDGTILSSEKETTASVQLSLNDEMDEEQAASIARYVATALGNDSTDGVTILDRSTSYVLYSGSDEQTAAGQTSTQLNAKQKQTEMIRTEVKNVLKSSKLFSDVEIGVNADISFDETETASHTYGTMDGSNKGPITEESTYNAEATGDLAGVPGTTSNSDDTTYLSEDENVSSSTIEDIDRKYATDETITKTKSSGGAVNTENSSISVVATRYRTYTEEEVEAAGDLEDVTWDTYKRQNSDPVQSTDPTDDYVQLIANATGIPAENISFVCYEQPIFEDEDNSGKIGLTDILQIVLAVLIFALLGYVVFRSTRSQEEPELEPELSVEDLLESTSERQELEDIGYNDKSETRILIEKFVDENPDAVATLLRNWLNEEWE